MRAVDRWESMLAGLEDLVRRHPSRRVVVPDVVGLPVSEAAATLGRTGLRVSTRTAVESPPPREATVVAQSVPAGKRRRRLSWVTLDLEFPPPWG
jgi:beta-lactam-binding protein with PASTA domain